MFNTKLTSQGTISIPAKLRKKYNLLPGDELSIEDNGKLIISKAPDVASVRKKNQPYVKKGVTYQSGDGFAAYVNEKYGS